MVEKEKMELLNLRNRVETQREEIKKLSEQLERRKDYITELECMLEDAINHMDLDWYNRYSRDYDVLKHTA